MIFCNFVLVKEKVTDISDVLLTLKDNIHSLRETIASQHSEMVHPTNA